MFQFQLLFSVLPLLPVCLGAPADGWPHAVSNFEQPVFLLDPNYFCLLHFFTFLKFKFERKHSAILRIYLVFLYENLQIQGKRHENYKCFTLVYHGLSNRLIEAQQEVQSYLIEVYGPRASSNVLKQNCSHWFRVVQICTSNFININFICYFQTI